MAAVGTDAVGGVADGIAAAADAEVAAVGADAVGGVADGVAAAADAA